MGGRMPPDPRGAERIQASSSRSWGAEWPRAPAEDVVRRRGRSAGSRRRRPGDGRPLLDARPHRRHQGLSPPRPVRGRARAHRGRRGRARCARLPEPSRSRGVHGCAVRAARAARPGTPPDERDGAAGSGRPRRRRRAPGSASPSSRPTPISTQSARIAGAWASPPRRCASTASASTAAVARGDASIYLRLPTRPTTGRRSGITPPA